MERLLLLMFSSKLLEDVCTAPLYQKNTGDINAGSVSGGFRGSRDSSVSFRFACGIDAPFKLFRKPTWGCSGTFFTIEMLCKYLHFAVRKKSLRTVLLILHKVIALCIKHATALLAQKQMEERLTIGMGANSVTLIL